MTVKTTLQEQLLSALSAWILSPSVPRSEREAAADELRELRALLPSRFSRSLPEIPPLENLLREEKSQIEERIRLLTEACENALSCDEKTKTELSGEEKRNLAALRLPYARFLEAYSSSLHFGTAGLRAVMGPGPNRMNIHTLAVAAAALAETLKTQFSEEDIARRPVVIGHDARHNARIFCERVAATLAGCGLRVIVTPDYCATPLLAYVIRPLRALCGLMVTASHNTGEYNGLKLYAEDGIQSDEQMAASVAAGMERISKTGYAEASFASLKKAGLIQTLDARFFDEYFDAVRSELPAEGGERELRIAYTPVHGVGAKFILPLFESLGFGRVFVVESEKEPDPDFTDIPRPNPEYEETLAKLKALAEQEHCDIALATDPDADRFALMLPQEDSHFRMMNGNETAGLLIDYYADYLKERGELPERPVLVKSIVSDFFAADIARTKGIELCESLTGFKNICGKRRLFAEDAAPRRDYIMGFEESIGFALGDAVRDKDGLRTACYVLKAALRMKKQGKTLFDRYLELCAAVGIPGACPIQIEREGLEGKAYIEAKMKEFREAPFPEIAGLSLRILEDYSTLTRKFYRRENGELHLEREEKINELSQNALRYFYEDGLFFALRPSGTEPKVKFYLYAKCGDARTSEERIRLLEERIRARLSD